MLVHELHFALSIREPDVLCWKAIGAMALSFLLMGSKIVVTVPEGDSVALSSVFNIKATHLTKYYEITGDTSEQLWRQLRSDANPLSIDPAAGERPFGDASVAYSYTYQPEYDGDLRNCRVRCGEIHFKFETVLPQLADFEGKSDRLRRQWLQFQAVIIEHEAGHHKIYLQLVKQIPEALDGVGVVPCSELDDRIKVAVSRVVNTMRQASAEYDEETGPGKTMNSSL